MYQQAKPSKRRRARECTVQALYSWFVSQNAPEKVELDFVTDEKNIKGADLPYFRKLFHGTVDNLDVLEELFAPYLDRSIDELGMIERAILACATYELRFVDDVPYKVVINEAIEVTKTFGAEDSHKYINGVLDKLAPQLGRK
ncbi:transcription antitermination factor NusB [Gallibacterium salpingitidis]|uniref:transcription antitermination factor NusB n=1 Tax=Gallibacterium salpingitidis TaxID=505341 RepID=UPI00266F96D1|nr:transcription antitermination factor NusB [Gallibacterium salpingitidis]WKT00580.1 transcription antitermination factor NusB [Gallibacterium salpingitidis]